MAVGVKGTEEGFRLGIALCGPLTAPVSGLDVVLRDALASSVAVTEGGFCQGVFGFGKLA